MNIGVDQLNSLEFWQNFAAGDFQISQGQSNIEVRNFEIDNAKIDKAKKLFKEQGYLHLKGIVDLDFDKYQSMLERLNQAQIPAVFGFIYDEFWISQAKLENIAKIFLGSGVKVLPTQWMWYVDAQAEKNLLTEKDKELATRSMFSGFYGPHRDKGKKSLYADGSPKLLSFWIPFNDATPHNSCIYIVPADRDPSYNTDDEDSWSFRRADIRALPAKAGDLLFWNEAVLHWASRPAQDDLYEIEPRISAGFEIIAAEFDGPCQPVFDLNNIPDFKTKLEIIATQFKLYITEEGFPKEYIDFIKANDRLIKQGKEKF